MASSLDILETLLADVESVYARQSSVLARFREIEELHVEARYVLERMKLCQPSLGEPPRETP